MTEHDSHAGNGLLWRMHVATYSEVDDNGFIGIQFDAFGEGDSGMPTVEAHFLDGYMCRPLDPDVDSEGKPSFGCNVLVAWEGHQAHVIPLSDSRKRPLLPVLQKGERMIYGATGSFVRMHADGRISLFTTDDATPNGKTVALQVMPDGLLFSSPWGTLKFDNSGFHLLHVSGAGIDLGAIAGLPAPLDQLGSYCTLTAAIHQRNGTAISDGPAGATDPVAKSTPLLTFITSVMSYLTTVQTAIVATGSIPGAGGVMSGPIAACTTAFGLTSTAAGVAATAIPAVSTGAS